MIYITGDMHGKIDMNKFYMRNFPQQKGLTKQDIVIICGDFGGIWTNRIENERIIRILSNRPWTTLFCDGNHENFEYLYEYPEVDLFGGRAHQISSSIYHLMRGEIYTIEGSTFFVMGGAASHDRPHIQGLGWWEQELPSMQEYDHAMETLDKYHWQVDYVITHCAPSSIQQYFNRHFLIDGLTSFLEDVKKKLTFKNWYFGHYHINQVLPDDRFQCLYRKIIPLEKENAAVE